MGSTRLQPVGLGIGQAWETIAATCSFKENIQPREVSIRIFSNTT